ncbi:peptidyl-trna hydrolase [Diplodia corticola]|uniref:peptidyl-tRNA hydrolase n=1 Tax=Diplodia corticola TaxID=236234 RepID=A0A1J9REX2_9PEZI|nr:peptidyl-trna hydrolase [Diplodia corticola]OJD38953.1 peptidyl-trna hydrolase [Diplodia corticola]
MAESLGMTKAIDACAVPEADTDAPHHQKVSSADNTAVAQEAAAQLQQDLASSTTPDSSPQPARQRTPAQRKRDRKKGITRRNDHHLVRAEEKDVAGSPASSPEDSSSSSTRSSSSSSPAPPASNNPNSTSDTATTIPRSMPAPKKAVAAAAAGRIVPLFIASLGNPGATYAHTLHSAGHTVLDAIRDLRHFPPWQKERSFANGLVSKQAEAGVNRNFSWLPGILGGGADQAGAAGKNRLEGEEAWTLWQSPSLMNVSGKALGQAWGRWKREYTDGELVVVHDELERPLGKVTVRRGGSARGHNGLKSLAPQFPNTPYVRIGVGIGRPESREPDAVAKYVLRKMTQQERAKVEGCADEVIRKLWEVQEGKI